MELLIPELQKRGIYWDDYPVPGGTARENLQTVPGQPHLPRDHPAAKFKWDAPKVETPIVEAVSVETPATGASSVEEVPASEVSKPQESVTATPEVEVAALETKLPNEVTA